MALGSRQADASPLLRLRVVSGNHILADGLRGSLEAGGEFRFTSEEFTGTFGLEAQQILDLQHW